jgi:hypothetical protein
VSRRHEQLMKDAENAINAVFGDTSVSKTESLEALQDLRVTIDGCIAAIRDDIKLEEG